MSMSPSHTELGVSRKRRHRHGPKAKACDSCWKRKIKCDKAVPKCAWCRHYCVTCTFNRRHSDRPPTEAAEYSEACNVAPRSNIVHTATQLGNQAALSGQSSPQVNAPLENLPKTTNGTPEKLSLEWFFNPSQRARSRAPVLQSGKIYLDGEELGTIDCDNGIPLFSSQGQAWVENRSGESIIYNEIRESPESCYTSSTNTSTSDRAPPLTLPPISLVESSLESFLRSRTRANFPLIDPNLFRETIQAAYGSSEIGPSRLISARICIATFLSFEAIFNLDIERAPPFNFEEYISAAENALPQLTAGMHLDGFQACVMLLICQLFSGKLKSGYLTMSLAAHFTFVLGAHVAPESSSDNSPKTCHKRHLRNLFWICYTLDKEFSLRTGNPSTLCDTNCDLTITPNYMQQLYVDLAPCLAKDECYPCVIFPSDARLSCVKSSIYQLLYSSSSVYKSDVQLLVDVRKLDDDLEAWRQAIPHKYRPGHSAQDPKDGNNSERDARVLLIRLEYECCLALIHKATSRCVVGTTSEIEKLPGLSSSHALAVQASRSSLIYLQGACHSLAETNFWLILFYPISAITTIFCNILQNPHDVSVELDLALLQAIPALTYAFQPRHLTSEAVHHARQLNDYAYELSRIAQCAVRKAKKNDIS